MLSIGLVVWAVCLDDDRSNSPEPAEIQERFDAFLVQPQHIWGRYRGRRGDAMAFYYTTGVSDQRAFWAALEAAVVAEGWRLVTRRERVAEFERLGETPSDDGDWLGARVRVVWTGQDVRVGWLRVRSDARIVDIRLCADWKRASFVWGKLDGW